MDRWFGCFAWRRRKAGAAEEEERERVRKEGRVYSGVGKREQGRSERAREVSGGASVDKREQIYAPARSVGCVDGGQGRPSGQVRPLRKGWCVGVSRHVS